MKNIKCYMLALTAFVLTCSGCKKASQSTKDEDVFAVVNKVIETDGIQTEIDLISENKQSFILYRRDIFQNKYNEGLSKYFVGDTVKLHYDKKTKRYDKIISSNPNRSCIKLGNKFLIKNKNCCGRCR